MRAAGLVLGTLAALASLTPSLLPRPAVFQGALAALSFLLGYLLGTLVHRGVRRLVEQRRARVSGPGPTAVPPASARSAGSRLWRAVAELERTGAFDREVLVVATTTGSAPSCSGAHPSGCAQANAAPASATR